VTTTTTLQRPPHRQGHDVPSRRGWVLAPRILLGLAVIAFVAVSIVSPGSGLMVAMTCFGAVVMIVIVGRYGWRLAALYLAVAFTVATIFENLSITTGFPFGHYHYPGNSLRIWHFPVMVGVLYGLLGLICWLTASALLDGADLRLADRSDPARRINVVAMPMLAAALMSMYDLGNDSVASTIGHTWVWENGGGVFGVPWTNYLGWWLVCYIYFQIFAVILATRTQPLPQKTTGREPLAHGVVAYLLLGFSSLTGFLTTSQDTVTDLSGRVWSVHALHETMFTINLFGTIVIAALAAIKLARNDLAAQAK
jgi:uncharacterized membrane protein